MSDLDDNYDEDYRKLRDLIFYISIVIFSDFYNMVYAPHYIKP